jgi:hypothetical protein
MRRSEGGNAGSALVVSQPTEDIERSVAAMVKIAKAIKPSGSAGQAIAQK